MRYLVLGSAGQIGSELVKYLEDNGHKVDTFDIVDGEKYDLRIKNNRLLISKIKKCDFVYFLAFDVGGSVYLKKYQDKIDFIRNNILIMEYTFKIIEEHKKPFIFASSQMSNMSESPYGILKAIGETYTKALNGLIVKFWNVYGVERDLSKTHVITDFIMQAYKTGEIRMLTNGEESRQFLHANDCSRCLKIIADNYNNISRENKLHITSFRWTKISEIAEIVKDLFGIKTFHKSKEIDLIQRDKMNEPDEYILRLWTPIIDIKTGIELVKNEICV